MLPTQSQSIQDAVRAMLARLDWLAQVEAERLLIEALGAHHPSSEPEWEPGTEDWLEYDNWLERLETERASNCNMRFSE